MKPTPRPNPVAEQENQPLQFKDFIPHLNELRRRLTVVLLALVVFVFTSFVLVEPIIHLLTRPIGGPDKLISIEVTENVSVFMRVSLLTGFILALPVLLYEIIAFLQLEPAEKRWLYWLIPFATLLFVAGVAFAYFVMLPTALPFLIEFLGIRTTPRLSNYFNFVTNLLFWIGMSFETPLFVFVLARLKLVTARGLARQWRIAVVVIAILSAVITPTPDPINMGLLMLPLFLLYWLSVFMAFLAR